MRDYYEILGVDRTTDEAEIKKAYRRLAIKYHPDKSEAPDAEEKFKEASEAYEVLSDSTKKKAYDQFGHTGVKTAGKYTERSMRDIQGAAFFRDLFGGDLFASQFGPARGSNLVYELTLEFDECAKEHRQTITVERDEACLVCDGSGADPDSPIHMCHRCNGEGVILQAAGAFAIQSMCPQCQGNGEIVTKPCLRCKGSGCTRKPVEIEVKVPAGIANGQKVRIARQGNASGDPTGERGDLFVDIQVKPHPLWERSGDDLVVQVPISYPEAALGAAVDVPSLNGIERVKVPAGTRSGKVFKLTGKGFPNVHGRGKGNLLVQCQVEVPQSLNKKEREAVEALKTLQTSPHPKNHPLRAAYKTKLEQLAQSKAKKRKNA